MEEVTFDGLPRFLEGGYVLIFQNIRGINQCVHDRHEDPLRFLFSCLQQDNVQLLIFPFGFKI